jgi:hypothetical protein
MTVMLGTDDTWSGIALTANAGETITQWDTVYFDFADNEWKQADANQAGEFPAWGIATAAGTDGNALVVMVRGCYRDDGNQGTYADGALLYLSETAGAETSTAPSDVGDCVQPIGRVIDTGSIAYFCVNVDPISGWSTVTTP